ncbi:hypothetical protein CDAR_278521 [Caerostris darwini]|uniref:Uncharacterized protein n=1 Tax=Caerostris darwini TaxID=1538125 RepID=A0AAV4WRG7_9ARAC|nr:hypothetical protein CDAR_278521 [Caerostris darwini]
MRWKHPRTSVHPSSSHTFRHHPDRKRFRTINTWKCSYHCAGFVIVICEESQMTEKPHKGACTRVPRNVLPRVVKGPPSGQAPINSSPFSWAPEMSRGSSFQLIMSMWTRKRFSRDLLRKLPLGSDEGDIFNASRNRELI